MRVRAFTLFFVLIASVRGSSALGAQTPVKIRHEVIQGRVTTDSGVAIAKADVIVTMAPSAETFSTMTSADGSFSVAIPNGTGEYLVYAGALGRRPFKQRVTRTGTDSVFTFNAKLASAVTTVGTVKVSAARPRPTRSVGLEDGKGTNGMDRTADGVAGALAPELQGNLDAMASMVPGLTMTPTGPSAFGLGSDANRTSLNGLDFAGGDLPRDAKTATRFQLSPWDPASGGFAGALVAVTLMPGDNIARRHGHVTLDNPSMQFSDRIASRTGQTFSNVLLGEGGTGALVLDKYFYNYGAQVTRNTAPTSSLLSLDADVLAHAGLSADSAERLVRILGAQGVPLRAGAADARTTTTATFMERIDHSPSAVITGHAPSRTWSMTGYGRYSRSDAQTLAPTMTPAFAGSTTSASGGLQGIYSASLGAADQYLNETTSGLSFSNTRGTPNLSMPGGSVLVSSSLADGANGLSSVLFGGNSQLASDVKSFTWETVNQTTFLPAGFPTMPLHVYLQSRYTGFDQSMPANRLGRFDFASLSDLAAGHPSAYTRTLNSPDRSGGEWLGAAALGGTWTRGRVIYTGGARLDANVFTKAPSYNADVAQAFGARTDHAPNDLGVSPRLGFTWYYNGKTGPGWSSITNLSTVTLYRGTSSIRGGVGEFRNVLPATLLADAIGSTGLSDATQQLRCVGAAAPTPDWQAFSASAGSIPTSCAGDASAFTDSARSVSLFDKSYSAPRTWKGTLGWTTWNRVFYMAIDGTYALNLNQAGVTDLNFAGTPAFKLDNEGNRPVFVAPSAFVAGTGAASTIGSRTSAEFGRVLNRVSNLRGDARQLSVYLMPGATYPFNLGIVSLGYTYVDARSQSRGFDQSAAGDPRNIEWGPSFAPRHSLVAQAFHQFTRPDVVFSAAFRASSGLPYTPIVSGDINGDGVSGDRAFIFDPSTTQDAALGKGVRDLLANGSGSARSCLRSQLGEMAGRNSCVSAWTATLNAGLAYSGDLPGAARRAHVSLSMLNVLGGLDEALHGANQLRGWGSAPVPDPVLYRVRGFDATNQRFLYDVNGRFGGASPATTMLRAPFRLSLDVSIDLGRATSYQGVEQSLRIRPGLLGTRAPADTIKKRYIVSFTDIYGQMLKLSDSLALSREQIQQVQQRRVALTAHADTLYGALAAYLAALPKKYDDAAALAHINATQDAMWEVIYAEVPFVKTLLTPGQIQRLPLRMNQMVTIKGNRGRFYF